MASPLRSEPSREHRVVAPRPMVRATAGVSAAEARSALRIVPRRRRTARLVAVVAAGVFIMMAGATAFQTQVARRQLELDRLDRAMTTATDQYDLLRRERAELRSPGRLIVEASALGMTAGLQSEFVALSPDVVATIQQSVGVSSTSQSVAEISEIDRLALVKSVVGAAP